jgi:GAF domain-containing protein
MKAESYVGITLLGTSGAPIGIIALISRKPLESTLIAETVLKQVSIRAAAELEFRLLIRKVNRTFKALEKSSIAMQKAADESSLLNEVCQIIVDDCGFAMVWIGYAGEDSRKTIIPVASAGFDKGYLETLNLTWADEERGNGPTGTAIRTGKIRMCRNMLTDPKFKPWREEAIKRGYSSSIVFPLTSHNHVFGAVTIYSSETDPFKEDEIRLLSKLTDDLAHGISAIRLKNNHL